LFLSVLEILSQLVTHPPPFLYILKYVKKGGDGKNLNNWGLMIIKISLLFVYLYRLLEVWLEY